MALVQSPAGGRARPAGGEHAEGPRGRARRRVRDAVRRGGAALDRAGCGRRPRPRARRPRSASRPSRRCSPAASPGRPRSGTSRASRAPAAAGDPRVPRRRLRRARLPGARAGRDPRDAARTSRRSCAATVRALQRGYGQTQNDPESAVVGDARRASPASIARSWSAQLDAVAPEFTAGAAEFGELRPSVLRAWAEWDAKFGILREATRRRRARSTRRSSRSREPRL